MKIELCYFWIRSAKYFENEEFNFGSKYNFNFDATKQELTVKENINFIKNFFGTKISNITSIIGENGSGKTSILKYIIKELSKDKIKNGEVIIILNCDDIYFCYYSGKTYPTFRVNIKKIVKLVDCTNNDKETSDMIANLQSISPIYYSDAFVESIISNSEDANLLFKTSNITTWDYVNRFSHHMYFNKVKSDILKLLYVDDNIKNFIDNLNIQTPEYIKIAEFQDNALIERIFEHYVINNKDRVYSEDELDNNQSSIYQFDGELRTGFDRYRNYGETLVCNNDSNYLFKYSMLINIWVKYILDCQYIYDQYDISDHEESAYGANRNYWSYELKLSLFSLKTNDKDSVNSAMETLFNFIGKNKIRDYHYLYGFEERCKIYQELIKLVDQLADLITKNNKDYFLNKKFYKEFYNFINTYTSLSLVSTYKSFDFVEISWIGRNQEQIILSSGEESMLTLFSRLYLTINEINPACNSDKNYLLILDEPEIYFHPKWQRDFINFLTEFLNSFITGYSQILLTSNTPFLISDLPESNVILMHKCNDKLKIKKDTQIYTFGQNIHTLLKDSFFMSDGTIGKFARNKIDNLITEINCLEEKMKEDKTYVPTSEVEEFDKKIKIIGEPMIKRYLESRLLDILPEKQRNELIDKEIERLTRLKHIK